MSIGYSDGLGKSIFSEVTRFWSAELIQITLFRKYDYKMGEKEGGS